MQKRLMRSVRFVVRTPLQFALALLLTASGCLSSSGERLVADRMGVESMLPSIFAFWGGIFVLFGPSATGSGFFVKGFYVDSATPAWLWRIAGAIMWIIGVVILINLARA